MRKESALMAALGENCSSRCLTRDHRSFGECMKGFGILGEAHKHETAWDKELFAYADAKRQGISPAGTTMKKIDDAVRVSNELGIAYDASANVIVED